MAKKLLAVIFLAGLVAWGIYDMGNEKSPNLSETKEGTILTESEDGKLKTETGIQQGNIAPDFQLKTIEGQNVKLSDLRGQKVILNFWASWCPPCRAEMPDMQNFYQKYKDQDVTILGVNLTATEKKAEDVAAFAKEYGLTFPIVLDDQSVVGGMYQTTSIPTSYMIDTQGVIQNKIVGPMTLETMEELVLNMD